MHTCATTTTVPSSPCTHSSGSRLHTCSLLPSAVRPPPPLLTPFFVIHPASCCCCCSLPGTASMASHSTLSVSGLQWFVTHTHHTVCNVMTPSSSSSSSQTLRLAARRSLWPSSTPRPTRRSRQHASRRQTRPLPLAPLPQHLPRLLPLAVLLLRLLVAPLQLCQQPPPSCQPVQRAPTRSRPSCSPLPQMRLLSWLPPLARPSPASAIW